MLGMFGEIQKNSPQTDGEFFEFLKVFDSSGHVTQSSKIDNNTQPSRRSRGDLLSIGSASHPRIPINRHVASQFGGDDR